MFTNKDLHMYVSFAKEVLNYLSNSLITTSSTKQKSHVTVSFFSEILQFCCSVFSSGLALI